MSLYLILPQCPACLVRLILIVFVMGCRWPYSCCFVGCCLQDLFSIARSILVLLSSSCFSIRLVSVHMVHPYSSIGMTAAWKKLRFILSVRSDFHMTDSLSIALDAFAGRVIDICEFIYIYISSPTYADCRDCPVSFSLHPYLSSIHPGKSSKLQPMCT